MVILVDNVGYGDLGCHGNAAVQTPHRDALARDGVRCLDFYGPASSCMPSRAALRTGRHPLRTGVTEQVDKIDSDALGPVWRELSATRQRRTM